MLPQKIINSRKECCDYQLSQNQKFKELITPLLQVNIDWFAYLWKILFRSISNL